MEIFLNNRIYIETMSTIDWELLKSNFNQRLVEMDQLLKTWIEDIQAIDIVTATALTDEGIKVTIDPRKGSIMASLDGNSGINIKARTTLQLDGDYIGILPTKKTDTAPTTQIDTEVLTLHKENVKFAIDNYSNNLKIMTDAVIKLLSSLNEVGILKQ